MKKFIGIIVTYVFLCPISFSQKNTIESNIIADICVYGASGAGIFAAVAAAREGYSVTISEHDHKIGGLLGSGF